jgi:hypothetical protein
MTRDTKQLVAISLLPVLADFLEDQEFNKHTKHLTSNLIAKIRAVDEYFINQTKAKDKAHYNEIIEQQINIQLHFRNYIKEYFK